MIHSGTHTETHSFVHSGRHSLITVFSPSSTQVHPPKLRFSPSPSLISPSLLRPSTVHASPTHCSRPPRAPPPLTARSLHTITFPEWPLPRAALAWGPAGEASANIDFGGGVLKVRSCRARTPQTPGFRGEAAEGAGRGVRSARLRALTSRGPQLGHQAGRAAGAGRAGDPRPEAELTSRRAARLWAAPRPAHPGQQLQERGGEGRRRRSGPGEGNAGLARGCPSASRGSGLGAAETRNSRSSEQERAARVWKAGGWEAEEASGGVVAAWALEGRGDPGAGSGRTRGPGGGFGAD